MKTALTFLILTLAAGLLSAQETAPVKFTGSVQLRSEADARDFNNATALNTFTTMRTRLAAEKTVGEFGKVVFELQDSRTFGATSASTVSNDKNIDAHQAYILVPLAGESMQLQAGRFEMVYGNERFFGALGWSPVARSFDGFRLRMNGDIRADVFALNLREVQYGTTAYSYAKDTGSDLFGGWATWVQDQHQIDAFSWYEESRPAAGKKLFRSTSGLTYGLKEENFLLSAEAAYQLGSVSGVDLSAWMAAFSVTLPDVFGDKSAFSAGADLLSGTKAGSSELTTFSVPYGTTHKFYGFMDYHYVSFATQGGLQDYFLKLKAETGISDVSAACDLHFFNSFEENPAGNTIYGQEIDLTLVKPITQGIKATWGTSVYLPGDVMKESVYPNNEDPAYWTYLQFNVMF